MGRYLGSFLHVLVLACTYVCTSAYGCDPITANCREKRGDRAPINPIKGLPSLT